ncbi:MAG: hypothetical protein ACLPV4_09320 [Solirubrobacteraceae bacterium]
MRIEPGRLLPSWPSSRAAAGQPRDRVVAKGVVSEAADVTIAFMAEQSPRGARAGDHLVAERSRGNR